LEGRGKDEVAFADADKFVATDTIMAVARGSFRGKREDRISGSGYVVASLEAALWSFFRTDSFPDAVLTAANLGDDADTTAAICGQVAGAYYGGDGIPTAWLARLSMLEEITALADRLVTGRKGTALGDVAADSLPAVARKLPLNVNVVRPAGDALCHS